MGETTLPITGGCLCGAVRFEVTGPPDKVGICHCRMCQRWTGSAFAAGVRFPRTAFRFTKGEPQVYRSSAIMERGFCGDCGSPLIYWYTTEKKATDRVWLSLGNFDDPSAFAPEYHYAVETQMNWLPDDGLPRHRLDEDEDFAAAMEAARDRPD
jgi:hypothetical protein